MGINVSVFAAAVGPALAALLLDTVLGVLLAAKSGGVSLQKLPGIAEKAATPILVGLGGTLLQAALSGNAAIGAAVVVVANTVTARALTDVKDKLGQLL